MTEVKGRDYLPKEPPRLLGGESPLLDEVVEQLSAGHVLKHEVQVLPVFIHVVQTQHVLVLDQLHDRDLTLHLLQHGLAQLFLVDDLDGHLLPQHAVGSQLDQT